MWSSAVSVASAGLADVSWNYRHSFGARQLVAQLNGEGVQRLLTVPDASAAASVVSGAPGDVAGALRQALDRYLAGQREDFGAIPLALAGGTAFQRAVWEAARQVPWSTTMSYAQLAALLGFGRGHARAVGRALGANPIHILVPCHRFLGTDGQLVNYAGGLDWKSALLALEGGMIC